MQRIKQRPVITGVLTIALVGFLFISGYTIYLAGAAGELPWQTDPTRIPVTPFSGFSAPTPLPTAVP